MAKSKKNILKSAIKCAMKDKSGKKSKAHEKKESKSFEAGEKEEECEFASKFKNLKK